MATNTEPKWYEAMVKSGYQYVPGQGVFPGYGAVPPEPGIQIRNDNEPNAITLRSGSEDMIRCSTEGFWVRGVKVPQDDKEAEFVYNAFKQWLTWATLNDLK